MIKTILPVALCLLSSLVFAEEATLKIKIGTETKSLTREQLLKFPSRQKITIPNDPAYTKHPMEYEAVPLNSILKDFKIPGQSTIAFKCLDGFSACLLYTSPSPRDGLLSRMPSSA